MHALRIAALSLAAFTLPASALAQEGQSRDDRSGDRAAISGPMTAGARMKDAKGNALGDIAFVETPNGMLIQVRMRGLPPGLHGFHIHEKGACEPPDFKSAGGHFNPTGAQHGILTAQGPHVGDLPNIVAAQNGDASVDIFTDALRFGPGEDGLLPSGSRSVVVHATLDDYATQPAGASGDRIACGVIEQAPGPER